ncbi:MAG: C13 family peptidase [Hyphomonadaceae bacterium]
MRTILAALFGAVALAAAGAASAQSSAPDPNAPKPIYRGYGMQGGELPWPASEEQRQQKLIDAALATLQPERPGVHDVYVLSLALFGEHVFESEATKAADILSQRFGAEGRTLVLSNNNEPGAKGLPAAIPAHVLAAFNRYGALMDKEDDLFVLFLTTHGVSNAGVVLTDPKRMQYVMTPGNLRMALDKAGIKKRVLILSACFSGQFIPAFSDENTILLTAASATQPSFGCNPERDWTYFGDAYFNHALPSAAGLVPAFQRAKKIVTEWETRDQQKPSDPQIYVGPAAAKLLATVEAAPNAQPALASAPAPASP